MSIRWPSSSSPAAVLLCALGLVLAAAPATAQLAGGQVANDVCGVESNRVDQLRDALRQAADVANYPGTDDEKLCDNFVARQVKNCIAVVKNGTRCRETLDATEQKIAAGRCKESATKAERKACEQDAVLKQRDDDLVANTLRLIGSNNCNGAFETAMRSLCQVGWPVPP